jgi:hypothetical protein
MFGEELLPRERMDGATRRRWAVLMMLAVITLMLVTYGVYTSQAAIPIEQVECDASGRPAYGILPQDDGAVDIYNGNILNMVGCMGDIDAATPEGTPAAVYDHGLNEPLALH